MVVKDKIQTMKGSKLLFQTLKTFGVDTIFGYPGGIVLDLYEELYNQSDIKHILVRHEQSAVHSAEGYYRATGKCGVVLVTSGPGATNTVTGLANAYLDSSALIVITGQVFRNLLGKNAFQEVDICEITKSCTKKVFQVSSVEDLQSTLVQAHKVAMSGKKGPVVVDIVKDVFTQEAVFEEVQNFEESKTSKNLNIDNIVSIFNNSKKPVIVAGGGVIQSNSQEVLFNFAKSRNIPVVDTMMGQGGFDQNDKNYTGMIGIFGENSANQILKEADVILSLGARFNDRILCKFTNDDLANKIIQIDINESEINNFFEPLVYSNSDISEFLTVLSESMTKCYNIEWLEYAHSLKAKNIQRRKTTNMLHSFEIVQALQKFFENKTAIYTTEVGQHQLWAIQNLTFDKNHRLVTSGGLGTMGFGLPASIGVAVANHDVPVVCLAGDGSFQMSMHELATCVENNLNIKILIFNNGYLGMVRQLQEKNCNSHYSQTKISNPDFVALAKSYGVEAIRVTSANEVESALTKAFSNEKTFIIDFVVEPMEVL